MVVCAISVFMIVSVINFSRKNQSWESLINRLAGAKLQEMKIFVDDYRQSGAEAVADRVYPDLLPILKGVEKAPLARYFSSNKPLAVKPMAYYWNNGSDMKHRKYTFQYDFDEKPYFLLGSDRASVLEGPGPYSIMVALEELEENNKALIMRVNIEFLSPQEKQIGEFSLKDKSFFHLTFLAAAILIPAFILLTLIQFIRLPEACQKSRWLVFITLGVMNFHLNWFTGGLTFDFLSVSLLGAGVSKLGAYDPWIISVSLPIGALLFWIKRKKWLLDYEKSQQQ
jgi:hypothetical protein